MKKIMTREYMHTIVGRVHRVVIGGTAGERTMRFAKNLSITFTGGLGAFVLLFFANIVAARVLGPQEYGVYAVFFAIAQILSLFYVMELDVSALYFLSDGSDAKKETVSSILIMCAINITVFTLLGWSVLYFVEPAQISHVIFIGAIGFACVIAAKRMIDAFLRADEQFVQQAFLRFGEGVVVVLMLIIAVWGLHERSFISYASVLAIGGGFFVLIGGFFVRHFFTMTQWTSRRMNEIFHYNIFGLINATINGIVKNVDTLIIAAVMGIQQAGVYAIYFTASVVIGARITQLFISVFFPTIRTHKDRVQSVVQKVDHMFVRIFVVSVLCASGGVAMIVLLYGSAYPFVWQWVLLGGLYIVVHFFASLYGWILSSVSREGYKVYNLSYIAGIVFYGGIVIGAYVMHALSISVFLCAIIMYRIVAGIIARYELRNVAL